MTALRELTFVISDDFLFGVIRPDFLPFFGFGSTTERGGIPEDWVPLEVEDRVFPFVFAVGAEEQSTEIKIKGNNIVKMQT